MKNQFLVLLALSFSLPSMGLTLKGEWLGTECMIVGAGNQSSIESFTFLDDEHFMLGWKVWPNEDCSGIPDSINDDIARYKIGKQSSDGTTEVDMTFFLHLFKKNQVQIFTRAKFVDSKLYFAGPWSDEESKRPTEMMFEYVQVK